MNSHTSQSASTINPARVVSDKAGEILGFAKHDISVLIRRKLLEPLGNPAPNGPKYFALCELLRLANDVEWLNKASKAVSLHWVDRNRRRRNSPSQPQTPRQAPPTSPVSS